MLNSESNKRLTFHTVHTEGFRVAWWFMTCLMQLFPSGLESNLGPWPHIASLLSSFPVSQNQNNILTNTSHTHTQQYITNTNKQLPNTNNITPYITTQ